ncbi:unnamed protein product [Rangifer tarandus platyrhynchus]|uniref:Uncharacterized protein n=2 Tax=Rangifer tarandus platyrhynchus TaxID=3082113 RepID=A0AC60A8U1_RANTA|nr:unnamed protein product [Rangifer tarandus platyrhynchus]
MQETPVQFLIRKIPWRRDRLPTPVFLGFHCGSAGKESACNAGDLSLIPGLGRSPGEGKGYPLQYSGLENSMDYPWSRQESDTTERLSLHFTLRCSYQLSKPLSVKTVYQYDTFNPPNDTVVMRLSDDLYDSSHFLPFSLETAL